MVAGSKGYIPEHVHIHYHHLTGEVCLNWEHNIAAADSTTGFKVEVAYTDGDTTNDFYRSNTKWENVVCDNSHHEAYYP